MNISSLMVPASKALKIAGRSTSQFLIKHSPRILTVIGITSGVAATYFACESTKKVIEDKPFDDYIAALDDLHAWKDEELSNEETAANFNTKNYMIALGDCYLNLAKTGAKYFWKPMVFGGVSITSILGANKILSVREVSAFAAATTFSDMYNNYRANVIEELGAEADKRFKFGIKDVVTEEVILDKSGNPKVDKNGEVKTKTIKTKVITNNMNQNSVYARLYAEGFVDKSCWLDDEEYNKAFLYGKLDYWNKELKRRAIGHKPGVVILNEIYEDLGYDRTKAGSVVGWAYWNHAEDIPEDHHCDGYISFGLDDIFDNGGHINEQKANFMNNQDTSVILDFNVDGPVTHLYREY